MILFCFLFLLYSYEWKDEGKRQTNSKYLVLHGKQKKRENSKKSYKINFHRKKCKNQTKSKLKLTLLQE